MTLSMKIQDAYVEGEHKGAEERARKIIVNMLSAGWTVDAISSSTGEPYETVAKIAAALNTGKK